MEKAERRHSVAACFQRVRSRLHFNDTPTHSLSSLLSFIHFILHLNSSPLYHIPTLDVHNCVCRFTLLKGLELSKAACFGLNKVLGDKHEKSRDAKDVYRDYLSKKQVCMPPSPLGGEGARASPAATHTHTHSPAASSPVSNVASPMGSASKRVGSPASSARVGR